MYEKLIKCAAKIMLYAVYLKKIKKIWVTKFTTIARK